MKIHRAGKKKMVDVPFPGRICWMHMPQLPFKYVQSKCFLWRINFLPLSGVAQWIERQPACKPKGHQFNSQSGHMPRLHATPPVGGAQKVSLHLFLPPFLSKKINNLKKNFLSLLCTWFNTIIPALTFCCKIHLWARSCSVSILM